MSHIWFSAYYYRLKDHMKTSTGNSSISLFSMANSPAAVCTHTYLYSYWDLLAIYSVY